MNENAVHGNATGPADPFASVKCDGDGCLCDVCGLFVPGMTPDDLPLYHECDQVKLALDHAELQTPGMLERAKNFFSAAGDHLMSGGKICSDAQIKERIAACRACDRFDAKREWCSICGCPITEERKFLSKLAWLEQDCPHPDGSKWPPNQGVATGQ